MASQREMELIQASAAGDLDRIRQSVGRGAKVDARHKNGMTPVLAAALNGHADVAQWLLVQGAAPYWKPMDTKPNDRQIDYIEFPATGLSATKDFYVAVFGWKFTDYGPDYTSFEDGRLAGGFAKNGRPPAGGPVVVIYAADLVATEAKVRSAGGIITTPAFDFPGGRRFHFTDPSGNELAVWSEK